MLGEWINKAKEDESNSSNYCNSCGAWWNECDCPDISNRMEITLEYMEEEDEE